MWHLVAFISFTEQTHDTAADLNIRWLVQRGIKS